MLVGGVSAVLTCGNESKRWSLVSIVALVIAVAGVIEQIEGGVYIRHILDETRAAAPVKPGSQNK